MSTVPCPYPQLPAYIRSSLLMFTAPCLFPQPPDIVHRSLTLSTAPSLYPHSLPMATVPWPMSTAQWLCQQDPEYIHSTLLAQFTAPSLCQPWVWCGQLVPCVTFHVCICHWVSWQWAVCVCWWLESLWHSLHCWLIVGVYRFIEPFHSLLYLAVFNILYIFASLWTFNFYHVHQSTKILQ